MFRRCLTTALWLLPVLDGSQYDVYVVYHSQKESKAMDKVLSQFLYRALPQVLEQKCGFRIFIHDRDAIPGEGLRFNVRRAFSVCIMLAS